MCVCLASVNPSHSFCIAIDRLTEDACWFEMKALKLERETEERIKRRVTGATKEKVRQAGREIGRGKDGSMVKISITYCGA